MGVPPGGSPEGVDGVVGVIGVDGVVVAGGSAGVVGPAVPRATNLDAETFAQKPFIGVKDVQSSYDLLDK